MDSQPSPISPIETPRTDLRAEGARRDAFIIDLIRRFGLLTSDLIQQRVANQFSLTSQHNILNRLKVLTERKEIYNLGRIASGHIVYGARPLKGRRHISHDLSVGRFGITLDGVATMENWCCDQATLQEERKQGERPFIPDARFILNGIQHFLEVHTGSQGEEVLVSKLRAYKKHHESIKQLAKIEPTLTTKIRVLFICQREGNVEKILQIISKIYGDSMLFWVGQEEAYRENPDAVLALFTR